MNQVYFSSAKTERHSYVRTFERDLLTALRACGVHPPPRPAASPDEADVLVALCSPGYYEDESCGRDWELFDRRLHRGPLPPAPRPAARVLVRWEPVEPPAWLPRPPALFALSDYAGRGLFALLRRDPGGGAYHDAVRELARLTARGLAEAPPRLAGHERTALRSAFALVPEADVGADVGAGAGAGSVVDEARQTAGPAPVPRQRAGDERTGPWRVLIFAASPWDRAPVPADRAYRLVKDLTRVDRLHATFEPATQVTHLDRMREVRPDIVQFACHGEDGHLLLENQFGDAHGVASGSVADVMAGYLEADGQPPLRAVVLNSCDSATIAESFLTVAETVVTHTGALDATCANLFAANFYRQVARLSREAAGGPGRLAKAADVAARETAAAEATCAPVRTGLVVRQRATDQGDQP